MSCFKNVCCGVICLCFLHSLKAQNNKPVERSVTSIRGTIGASTTFYNSNEAFYSRPSFSWNVNGNFVAKINEVSLPFSFVVSQYNKSNVSPYIQAGISPTYKWAKFLLGYRSINFSPLTYGGQTFKGIGVELNPKQFRFAAFYGRLNKAFNQDTSAGQFRPPQYSRTGYGFKIGLGNSSRFLDLIYFHSKDDSGSASLVSPGTKNVFHAQENAVLGTSFKLTMIKKLTWTGDLAISGWIQDLSTNNKIVDSANPGLKKFINNFLSANKNTVASYAGQSSLSYYSRQFNSSFGYRRIQPNFKTFGTPYLLNDIETLTLTTFNSVAKGKVSINTNLSNQHDNLNKDHNTELKTQVGNLNVNAIVTQHFSANVNYSGYKISQENGNLHLPDSLRLNDSVFLKQLVTQLNISPAYYTTKGNLLHYINGNLSLQSLKDKNRIAVIHQNSNNLSASANYTLSFIKQAVSLSFNYLFSRYKQQSNSYKSNGVTVGTSAQLLKNRTLNVQGNVGYYFNHFDGSNNQKNITYSFSSNYRLKHHSFRVYANYVYTPPNNMIMEAINKTFPYAIATKNFTCNVSYIYSF